MNKVYKARRNKKPRNKRKNKLEAAEEYLEDEDWEDDEYDYDYDRDDYDYELEEALETAREEDIAEGVSHQLFE